MRLTLRTSVLCLLATFALLPTLAYTQVDLNPSAPETYVVRRGDTLWSIAARFLREPWRWPEIWDANRAEVGDPDLIYPGDVLSLYYRDGQPRIGVSRAMRTVKLSPRVRVSKLDAAVPVIPVGAIRAFLTRPFVLEAEEVDRAPYVVEFPDDHIVAGTGDSIYVRSIYGEVGERFAVVRPGNAYRDSNTGEVLGYEALKIADVSLERSGDPARIRIDRMQLEVAIGDRLLPSANDEALERFLPRSAPAGTKARIISVLGGVTQVAQYNVVVLDRGSRDGLQPGHVLTAYKGGQKVRDTVRADTNWNWKDQKFFSEETWYGDWRTDGRFRDGISSNVPRMRATNSSKTLLLPHEVSGTLMVFRTFDHVCFALVMSTTSPMHVLDSVRAPPA